MNLIRGAMGAVLCTVGAGLAMTLRKFTTAPEYACRRFSARTSGKIGRRESQVSAAEVYQFTPDLRAVSTPTETVLAEDNTVIGELESTFGLKSCVGCVHFRLGTCGDYPGLCVKLAEPTTTRGLCDLWAPREN